jgi:hypothetical protein
MRRRGTTRACRPAPRMGTGAWQCRREREIHEGSAWTSPSVLTRGMPSRGSSSGTTMCGMAVGVPGSTRHVPGRGRPRGQPRRPGAAGQRARAQAALVFDGDVAVAWCEYGTPQDTDGKKWHRSSTTARGAFRASRPQLRPTQRQEPLRDAQSDRATLATNALSRSGSARVDSRGTARRRVGGGNLTPRRSQDRT